MEGIIVEAYINKIDDLIDEVSKILLLFLKST
jgi:hypothetical protein